MMGTTSTRLLTLPAKCWPTRRSLSNRRFGFSTSIFENRAASARPPCILAVETLLLADASHVNRNDHEDSPIVKSRSNLDRTGDGSLIHIGSRAEFRSEADRSLR